MDLEFYSDHNLDTRSFYMSAKEFDINMANKNPRVPKVKISLHLTYYVMWNNPTFNINIRVQFIFTFMWFWTRVLVSRYFTIEFLGYFI